VARVRPDRHVHGATSGDAGPSDRLWQGVEALANVLGRHVVPIYTQDDRARPELFASGLLVDEAGTTFIATAAHVLDALREERPLYIYVEPKVMLRLQGKLFVTEPEPGGSRDDDEFDVGVLRLDKQFAPPYPGVEKVGLPIGHLKPRALPRQRKQYFVIGYPSSKSVVSHARRKVVSKPYCNVGRSATPEAYMKLGISPDSNVVLEFDRRRVRGRGTGPQAFPEPAGMSGSPVWLLWDDEGPNDRTKTEVVAILTMHKRTSKVLVATDVAVVLEMIRELF
jgi:hypothetical protein